MVCNGELCTYLVDGKSVKEIAELLKISEARVRNLCKECGFNIDTRRIIPVEIFSNLRTYEAFYCCYVLLAARIKRLHAKSRGLEKAESKNLTVIRNLEETNKSLLLKIEKLETERAIMHRTPRALRQQLLDRFSTVKFPWYLKCFKVDKMLLKIVKDCLKAE